MFQILVMNESGILKPGFGFWKSYMQGEMGWRLIELGWTFLMVFAKFWVDYLWKLSNLMKKSVIKLALNFFGAYSGVLEDPILDIRWITNIVLKVLCGFEYLLNFSMRVNNEAQRTLIIVYYNIMYYKCYYKCIHTFHFTVFYPLLSLRKKKDSYVKISIIFILNLIWFRYIFWDIWLY